MISPDCLIIRREGASRTDGGQFSEGCPGFPALRAPRRLRLSTHRGRKVMACEACRAAALGARRKPSVSQPARRSGAESAEQGRPRPRPTQAAGVGTLPGLFPSPASCGLPREGPRREGGGPPLGRSAGAPLGLLPADAPAEAGARGTKPHSANPLGFGGSQTRRGVGDAQRTGSREPRGPSALLPGAR